VYGAPNTKVTVVPTSQALDLNVRQTGLYEGKDIALQLVQGARSSRNR
jgi:hypothetical protein